MTAAPTLSQAQAICAIRDRLWKYTCKDFRRFAKPRDAEALQMRLADLHDRLRADSETAARPISPMEIGRHRKFREELNTDFREQAGIPIDTDTETIIRHIQKAREDAVEYAERKMEPDRAASMPLYRSQYQPRYWAQLCEAGLVHDEMIRDPAEAAQFLEAKPKQSAEELPQTLEALIALHDETWKSITAKCPNSQCAEKNPKLVRIRSLAWNSAPAQVREKIESYLRLYGIKNCSLSDRFFTLADYVTKGPEAFEELVTKARRERDEYWEELHCLSRARRSLENTLPTSSASKKKRR
jgi:hypothetical protein